jgi:hypothetical protein
VYPAMFSWLTATENKSAQFSSADIGLP